MPQSKVEDLGIKNWPIWTCNPSTSPWTYKEKETYLVLEGDITTVTPDDGEAVRFEVGDLVVSPGGMSCTWEVHKQLKSTIVLAIKQSTKALIRQGFSFKTNLRGLLSSQCL